MPHSILVLARAAGLLIVALAGLGAFTAWQERTSSKVPIPLGLAVVLLLLGAYVGAAFLTTGLAQPLLAGVADHVAQAVIFGAALFAGLWGSSILVQAAQNLGRAAVGLPTRKLRWLRGPDPRHARRRR